MPRRFVVPRNPIPDRFVPAPRGPWKDVPEAQWNDWRWQQRERIRTLPALEQVIRVSDDERAAYERSQALFEMAITPYYAALMDPDNPRCPVRMQSVPTLAELERAPDEREDPLGEEAHMPVPGLTHRYPDRVLFYASHNCPVYCRHCLRKRKVADVASAPDHAQFEAGFQYIEAHPEVRDVIVSGGDPLTLSDERLVEVLSRLRAIPHVETLRLATRNLVTLPQRVTPALAEALKQFHPLFVHTHFNHPRECTRESFDAAARLADAGCILHNQMVLLRGINDDAEIVKKLNHLLLMMRIRPYYIFQSDPAFGTRHFRTPIEVGIDIIEKLRGWTSGMAVPHFVVDGPGGGGKIPLLPEYLQARDGKKWTFRNYKNETYEYFDP